MRTCVYTCVCRVVSLSSLCVPVTPSARLSSVVPWRWHSARSVLSSCCVHLMRLATLHARCMERSLRTRYVTHGVTHTHSILIQQTCAALLQVPVCAVGHCVCVYDVYVYNNRSCYVHVTWCQGTMTDGWTVTMSSHRRHRRTETTTIHKVRTALQASCVYSVTATCCTECSTHHSSEHQGTCVCV